MRKEPFKQVSRGDRKPALSVARVDGINGYNSQSRGVKAFGGDDDTAAAALVLTDEIISCAPDRPCVLAFRLPATRKGRAQATLRAPLTATVGEVRRQLWQQQGFELAETSVDLWLNGSRMRPEDQLTSPVFLMSSSELASVPPHC
ncbi:hypothetical protein DIPPA_17968 [Diplonema papillatum]|nr:hypothetical protein DIPPA_17968 [Diplonema papillatum]